MGNQVEYPLGSADSGRGYRVRPARKAGLWVVTSYVFGTERPVRGVNGIGVSQAAAHAFAACMAGTKVKGN